MSTPPVSSSDARPATTYADVVVVGGGPGGATAAAYLADAGRDVVLVEKDLYPREKPCGDGLTPRAVREVNRLGLVDESEGRVAGWKKNRGLRVHGGGVALELPWPELSDWPSHSLTCTRLVFDETIARVAVKRGAHLLEQTEVTGPIVRPDGRVAGVRWKNPDGLEGEIRAPIVIASDGASSRLGTAVGLRRRADRPLAVAVRTYYRSPVAETDEWLSSFLELREGDDLLPGYGWIFPLDDGTLNVGLGVLNTSPHFQAINYRRLMGRWAAAMPPEWGIDPDQAEGRILSAALPMGFSRTPLHHQGLMLVGDAGGMVNPMNGEGISYAMEAALLAAEVADRALGARSTAMLDHYDAELRRQWGGYYTLGRWFVRIMGIPEVMNFCTEYGMPIESLMVFTMKFMAHLTDEDPSDAFDLLINTLQRAAPAA